PLTPRKIVESLRSLNLLNKTECTQQAAKHKPAAARSRSATDYFSGFQPWPAAKWSLRRGRTVALGLAALPCYLAGLMLSPAHLVGCRRPLSNRSNSMKPYWERNGNWDSYSLDRRG